MTPDSSAAPANGGRREHRPHLDREHAGVHEAHYTHGHDAAVLAAHAARTAQNSAAYLLPHLRPGMDLLDVGSGPGTITLDLAAAVAPGRTVGIDEAGAALASAQGNAHARADTTTRFQLADVMDLPFPDDSFDVVHAHQVLQHLADPVGALREMSRVCRPGGWVAARDADYGAMAWYPEVSGIDLWRRIYSAIARDNGAEPDAGRRMRAWARSADLQGTAVTTSCWCYAEPTSCGWWGHSQAQRVSGSAFTTQAIRIGATESDVAAIAGAWRTWAVDPDAWFLIPHVEVLAHPASGTRPGTGTGMGMRTGAQAGAHAGTRADDTVGL